MYNFSLHTDWNRKFILHIFCAFALHLGQKKTFGLIFRLQLSASEVQLKIHSPSFPAQFPKSLSSLTIFQGFNGKKIKSSETTNTHPFPPSVQKIKFLFWNIASSWDVLYPCSTILVDWRHSCIINPSPGSGSGNPSL